MAMINQWVFVVDKTDPTKILHKKCFVSLDGGLDIQEGIGKWLESTVTNKDTQAVMLTTEEIAREKGWI